MAVFKILGTIVKILEGGEEKRVLTKTYVRAPNADYAEVMGINLGFIESEVSYFGQDHSTDLGNNTHYAADNGLGVLPGM